MYFLNVHIKTDYALLYGFVNVVAFTRDKK